MQVVFYPNREKLPAYKKQYNMRADIPFAFNYTREQINRNSQNFRCFDFSGVGKVDLQNKKKLAELSFLVFLVVHLDWTSRHNQYWTIVFQFFIVHDHIIVRLFMVNETQKRLSIYSGA